MVIELRKSLVPFKWTPFYIYIILLEFSLQISYNDGSVGGSDGLGSAAGGERWLLTRTSVTLTFWSIWALRICVHIQMCVPTWSQANSGHTSLSSWPKEEKENKNKCVTICISESVQEWHDWSAVSTTTTTLLLMLAEVLASTVKSIGKNKRMIVQNDDFKVKGFIVIGRHKEIGFPEEVLSSKNRASRYCMFAMLGAKLLLWCDQQFWWWYCFNYVYVSAHVYVQNDPLGPTADVLGMFEATLVVCTEILTEQGTAFRSWRILQTIRS